MTFLFNCLNEEDFTILEFYDLVKLYSVYHGVEIEKGVVSQLLSSLSSMGMKNVKFKKKKKS
jgi:hypothetical protein